MEETGERRGVEPVQVEVVPGRKLMSQCDGTDQRHCSLDRMTGFPAGGPAAPEGRVCGAVVSWQEWPASVHTCAYPAAPAAQRKCNREQT